MIQFSNNVPIYHTFSGYEKWNEHKKTITLKAYYLQDESLHIRIK